MNGFRIGTAAIVALVALRLAVGWHFYKEATRKFQSDSFTSSHFLAAAKGPLAGAYHDLVPDYAGRYRLNLPWTERTWEHYRTRAANHFGFDQDQQARAMKVYDSSRAGLEFFLADHGEDIDEYSLEQKRLETALKDTTTRDVAYQKKRTAQKETELKGKLNGWLRSIDRLWDDYEHSINAIATPEQRAARGQFPLDRAGATGFSSAGVDKLIPYFLFVVGVCLILGLVTRVAAVGGAVFLGSVILSQPPWVAGAEDTYYQTAEMLSLLVLAAVGAGRWGGLDFFIRTAWAGCCGAAKQGNRNESVA